MSTIRPKRKTPRRRSAPRGDGDWWAWATLALAVRSDSKCERCGVDLSDGRRSINRHHRQRREVGGDLLSNLLLLCGTGTTGCHGHITEHPEEAFANGWSVKALGGRHPRDVPVWISDRMWLLDDQGGKRPAP